MNLREKLKPFFRDSNGNFKNEISKEVLDFIYKEKLFKSFLPKELGGLSYSIQETLNLISDCSYTNGSLGWLIQIGNGGNYFASNFPKELSIQLFRPEKAVIAGSGKINGTVQKVNDGWIVNGKWNYCSGSDYATLFTFCIEIDGEAWAVIALKEQITIHNDWNTFGMKATSTNTIELKNQFIKKEQLFKVEQQLSWEEYSIFKLPFLIYAQAFFIHNLYGMIERLADESYNEDLKTETKNLLNQLKEEHNSILTKVENKIDLTELEQNELMEKYKNQAVSIQQQALKLFAATGIHGVYENNISGIFFRDILTVCQHKLLNSF
jgi:hypothetical protein